MSLPRLNRRLIKPDNGAMFVSRDPEAGEQALNGDIMAKPPEFLDDPFWEVLVGIERGHQAC